MKKLTKITTSILLSALMLSFATACGSNNKGDSNSGSSPPTSPTVTANDVINQSIAKMEDMMDIENNASSAQAMAFVTPNYNVDYENERLSVLRGSALALYFTEYIADPENSFENNTIYKNSMTVQDINATFYVEKLDVEGGVHVSLEMHQSSNDTKNISPIQVYFEYDYSMKQPIKTSIVSTSDNDNFYAIAVAQFDYTTKIAYSYNFQVSAANNTSVKAALNEKNFNFEKLSNCEIHSYTFAKLHTSMSTIESYGYTQNGTDESTATQDDVSALYTSIYNQVKNACVPVALLDDSKAVEKVFYEKMWTYGSNKVSAIK